MSELATRAKELAEKYVGSTCMEHCWCQYSEKNGDDYVSCEDRLVELIEQALLAEREQILDLILLHKRAFRNEACRANLVEAIRAAAEKEVVK